MGVTSTTIGALVAKADPKYKEAPVVYEFSNGRKFKEVRPEDGGAFYEDPPVE